MNFPKLDKKTLGLIASVVFGLVLFLFVIFKYPFVEVFKTFSNFSIWIVLGYLVSSVFVMVFLAWRWKIIVHSLGYKQFSLKDLFSYRMIGYGVSYITPSAKVGGEPVRAALMMKKKLSFKEGLSTVILDKTMELSFSFFFFAIGVILLIVDHSLPNGLLILMFIVAAILVFASVFFFSRIIKGKPFLGHLFRLFRLHKTKFFFRYEEMIKDFERPIINFYNNDKNSFWKAIGFSSLSFLMSIFEYKFLLSMLGIDASLGLIFIVFSLVGAAFIIPVPMGLGSLEATQVLLFTSMGMSSAVGVGVALITRSRDLAWMLVSFALMFYYGTLRRVLKESFSRDESFVNIGLSNGRSKRIKVKFIPRKFTNAEVKAWENVRKDELRSNKFWDKK